ncbi:trehalose-phosphatase [Marinithermus hydrothermalis]|uniref:Trehalose 6-phosphate phosphatase n=1 Tax=Marinithermus hydrothermalis (strain DSM 14884 / JCM 11576 / T1) TaxID=869210 RepID=F2NM31_MARHT|nr:trehalose-phosphatase [Marinithermus hydrothermalis]AEB11501.1 trehalose-phosphatase [Marinithermus hydrothermalis DSM 14884]
MKVPRAPNPLFLIDYDGTLAPLVQDPARAYPHPQVPRLLAELSRRHPLYLVTGRRVADLEPLLPVPGLRVVGVHGMEEGILGEEARTLVFSGVLERIERLRREVPRMEGVRLEDKGCAIALHYRGAPDEAAVVEALQRWVARLPEGLEPLWGKKVLEVRPAGYNKGQAVRRIVAMYPGRTPVYIGDDATDEEAFAALGEDALTIRVGPGRTRARYRLEDVEAVVAYLEGYLNPSKKAAAEQGATNG